MLAIIGENISREF